MALRMGVIEADIIKNAKLLLGIKDNSQDDILLFVTNDAINAVLAHCRIKELAENMYSLVSQIVYAAYRENGYGSTETPEDVKSISEGDRSITIERRKDMDAILCDFEKRLKPFINKRGKLPSEVV